MKEDVIMFGGFLLWLLYMGAILGVIFYIAAAGCTFYQDDERICTIGGGSFFSCTQEKEN
jgi:hypothetical protein